MTEQHLPLFPEFAWNGRRWVTSAKLPTWAGYKSRHGAYDGLPTGPSTDGTVEIVFVSEGQRENMSPSNEETGLVKWVVMHEAAVHDSVLLRLYEEYPEMRERMLPLFGKEEAKQLAPKIRNPQQLRRLLLNPSVFVHQMEKDGKPFIGVTLGCTWDSEHGAGVLLHGDKALEIGGADTAFTLWKVKNYL